MQAKTVILTANKPFLTNEDTSADVIHIEVNLDNYLLDNLIGLSDSLRNRPIGKVRLSVSQIPSMEDQGKIANFIFNLRHVESVVVSSAVFEPELSVVSRPPASHLTQLARQVTARNRFLSQFNALDCVDPARTIVDKWFSLNHNSNQKLYYLIPGMDADTQLHNTCFIEMDNWFFQRLLDNFPGYTNQWVINHDLNEAQLGCLARYVEQVDKLPFERLALYVDSTLTITDEFQQLLQVLSAKSLRGLTLVFPESELADENVERVATLLEKTVAPHVNFPVQIALQTTQLEEQPYRGDAFRSFETALIHRMQQANSGGYMPPITIHPSTTFFTLPQDSEVSTQKIALKQLLGKGKVPPKEIQQQFQNTYAKTEVQHVVVQQQQQQTVVQTVASQVQTVHQAQTRLQQTQQAIAGVYDGKLVDFAEFSSQPYRNVALAAGYQSQQIDDLYRVVQQEFFANMPHAIKYVSEEAAHELAEHLPHFCALNPDNLPEDSRFVLKQTPEGEIVLDVNRYASQKKVNPFTPKAYKLPAEQPLMYPVDLPEETVKAWISHDALFRCVCYPQGNYDTQKLQNVWAKFGEAGVVKLFAALNELDKQHPGLAEFLVNSYLNYFPDWEIFLLPQTAFFANLERLGKYNDTQLTCLKKFMVNSGCSQHHLTHTLEAFDALWENVSALCQERSANIADINSDWMTATGYVPIFLATSEQVQQLKPGEVAITTEKWADDYTWRCKLPRILTCHVKDETGQVIEFDITEQELETAWMERNPCIFIQANEGPDKDTLAKLPCNAYIKVGGDIYYFDHKKRHLLSVYEPYYGLSTILSEVQQLTNSCKYQMEEVLQLIDRGQPIELSRVLKPEQLSQISKKIYHYQNPIYKRLFEIPRRKLSPEELEPIWLDVLAIAAEKKYVQLKSGNPVVYMKRLWGILEKARSLAEQLIALDGVTLDNYSAPYASQFELFEVVSSGMGLCYRPDQQNAQPFNASMQCYFVGFEEVLAKVFDRDDDDFDDAYSDNIALLLVHLCRLVGQVEHGISINRYRSELRNYVNRGFMLPSIVPPRLTLMLFFLMHERYEGKISLNALLKYMESVDNHNVLFYLAKQLKQFFALNIYLNDVESVPLLQRLGGMNSAEFESTYGRNSLKQGYIQKLFHHLEKNKYGVFKLLQKLRGKETFIHALDIVDYWNTHYPVLGAHYREDLLLFAVLIGDINYRENMKDKTKQTKELEKINHITKFLMLAAESSYPNNYHYAFKLIVKSNQYFSSKDFIAAFKEISQLKQFEPEMVDTILKNHEFSLSIDPISISQQCYFQETLINLIFALNHFIATGDFLFKPPMSVSEDDLKRITKQEKDLDAKLELLKSRYDFLSQNEVGLSDNYNHIRSFSADVLLESHNLRYHFLSQKEFNLSENYNYQNYRCLFLTDQWDAPTLKTLNSYKAIDFPIVFTVKGWGKGNPDETWLAYINEQGNKQLKRLQGDFMPENYLPEIRTSALHFKKIVDASVLLMPLDSLDKDRPPTHKKYYIESLANDIADLSISRTKLNSEHQVLEEKAKLYQDWQTECTHLRKLSIKELNQRFFDLWRTGGLEKKIIASPFLHHILDSIKQVFITAALSEIGDSEFAKKLQMELIDLSDFKNVDDFNKLERAIHQANVLASSFKNWLATQSFTTYQKDFIKLFNQMDYREWNYDALLNTVNLIIELNPHDYRPILKQLLQWHNDDHKNVNEYLIRLNKIKWLSDEKISINTINQWMPFISGNIEKNEQLDGILKWVIRAEKSNDALLTFVSSHLDLSIESIEKFIGLTQELSLEEKIAVTSLFEAILGSDKDISKITRFLDNLAENQASPILKLIANCQAIPTSKQPVINYNTLAQQLSALSPQNFAKIGTFFRESALNIQGLSALILQLDEQLSIEESISAYEKAPLGPRDFEAQFDTSELSRIVNGITDLQNQSLRTYQARKQLMEAVLYVNDLGKNLPAYYGKPAKDLSDAEIKQLFSQLKNDELTFPNRFAKQLYALGLLREAFYRKTGEFAYCSQLAAIIDTMQKPDGQNVLQQIDTGQGKTLSDTLKAVILWLDREGGEVVTSSRADAKRDHGLFLGTLRFLGIPVADTPMTQTSDFDEFQPEGINYSTVSDLSLFYRRAEVSGVRLRPKQAKTFMVLSEADRATLDDHTIFRYAEFDPDGIGSENEWLYYGINDFVRLAKFKANNTSEQDDILALRVFLTRYANGQSKNTTIINLLTDEQLLIWIKSAIVVKRLLQKDISYIVRPGQKSFNGQLQPVFEVKIIQETDNRVDEEAVFDKTVQPLLCAYLNGKLKKNDRRQFVIEPSTKTILASNSKNLIQQYAKKGVIWGSTATAGSLEEVIEQVRTYGFVFSTIPPYQKNQVDKNPAPIITLAKELQYLAILIKIQESQAKGQNTVIVAWHDIPKAKAFYDWLKQQGYPEEQLQHYTDQDTEKELLIIQNAPDKITSSTRGLGRNTNIPYDREKGMLVIQTEPDMSRNTGQLAGRTGREGSEGTFLRIFNQEDFPEKTVEQAIHQLEETSQQRRKRESRLFDVFGYLLNHVDNYFDDDNKKATFLKTVWASFSEKMEAEYRRISAEEVDKKEKFIVEATLQFNIAVNTQGYSELQILSNLLESDDLINQYPLTLNYQIYNKKVEPSDCISPSIIAYHALPTEKNGLIEEQRIDEKNIKSTIKSLLENVNSSPFNIWENIFQMYLLPLMSDIKSLQAIRQIAQQELAEFLDIKLQQNAKLSWFDRTIMGVKSHLEQIADDQHYLVLFSALTASSSAENQEAIDVNLAKDIVRTLLTNYLTNSWFISSDKATATQSLINNLQNAENIAELITLLSTQKAKVLKQDIETNQSQTAFWQPSVNKTGSRFQAHLDKALLLLTSLQSEHSNETVLTGLLERLQSVVIPNQREQLTQLMHKKDFDSIKSLLPTLMFTDQNNARVILDSLDKWLNHQLHSHSLYRP